MRHHSAFRLLLASTFFLAVELVLTTPTSAVDLLNDDLQYSPYPLLLQRYVRLPAGPKNVISLTTRRNHPGMYVTAQEGAIYSIDKDQNGYQKVNFFFDAVSSIFQATGRTLYGSGGQDGLQCVAFHPDFDDPNSQGYGRFYTTLMESAAASPVGHHYLGKATGGDNNKESVLVEWTYNFDFGEVDVNSYREVFRARLPAGDHMIKQARFNPYALPGEHDYGLLYVTHGDSSSQQSSEDRPQLLDNAFGKMLRIDPLQTESAPYSIPASNPFAGSSDPNVLQEIYAYGFRNPHTFSFNRDDQGQVRILAGDIGRANIEEVNLVENGGNYGWPKREGTFVHSQLAEGFPNSGYYSGVFPIPQDEAGQNLDYIYPVAQYDHNNNFDTTPVNSQYVSVAIASGFTIQNGSDPNLQGKFIFTNFAGAHGNVYAADFDEMLAAKTRLEAGDAPTDLTQAELELELMGFDYDNDPNTGFECCYTELTHLLGVGRTDARFGEGVFGEMYITNKNDRYIYLVTNTMPQLGDYNLDHVVDAADYTVWRNSLGQIGYHLPADGNGDGKVDGLDYGVWKDHFGEVWNAYGAGSVAAGVPAVPEPTIVVLVGSILFAVSLRTARTRRGFRGSTTL